MRRDKALGKGNQVGSLRTGLRETIDYFRGVLGLS